MDTIVNGYQIHKDFTKSAQLGNSGSLYDKDVEYLRELLYDLRRPSPTPLRVMDIGFHIGHFAALALDCGADVESFAREPLRVSVAAKYNLDVMWTDRHRIHWGDIDINLGLWTHENHGVAALAFVNGSREVDQAQNILLRTWQSLPEGAHIAMVGVQPKLCDNLSEYTVGPTRAWWSAVENKYIADLEECRGFRVGQVAV